jgi:hypothetical protein
VFLHRGPEGPTAATASGSTSLHWELKLARPFGSLTGTEIIIGRLTAAPCSTAGAVQLWRNTGMPTNSATDVPEPRRATPPSDRNKDDPLEARLPTIPSERWRLAGSIH